MDVEDRVPLVLRHVEDHPVAQDAGVVDQDVELAERVDGGFDDAFGAVEVGHALEVRDRFAAEGLDFVHDPLGRTGVRAGAVEAAAQVVHHDFGAVFRQQHRFFTSDSAAGTGHYGDSSIE